MAMRLIMDPFLSHRFDYTKVLILKDHLIHVWVPLKRWRAFCATTAGDARYRTAIAPSAIVAFRLILQLLVSKALVRLGRWGAPHYASVLGKAT